MTQKTKSKSDRYLKIVAWSEADGCYVGTCPGVMYGGVHGDDETKVFAQLCEAVEEWVTAIEADGDPLPPETASKKYSGKFVLRVGPALHERLAIEALRRGESLNALCVNTLEQAVTGRRTDRRRR